MITPTMLCSTGVHSIRKPRDGWAVGDPNTLMVALAGRDSADDVSCCPTVVVKGCGPSVVVKGTAEDAACSWENAGKTYKDSTRMAARVSFIFVLSCGCSTCTTAPSSQAISLLPDVNRARGGICLQRDKLATLHSITSSARASSVGGTSRPRTFAVVRFTTRSNLVGCSTGRSPGFAPRRILST
jgi:hypothetical protein